MGWRSGFSDLGIHAPQSRYGFVARISGEGPWVARVRASVNPASRIAISRSTTQSTCCSIDTAMFDSTDGLPGPVIRNRFGKPVVVRPRYVVGPWASGVFSVAPRTYLALNPVTLLVIPPTTDQSAARDIMRRASTPGNCESTDSLLGNG